MKLYEIPKGSKLKVELESGEEAVVIFDHVDGMYSYCYLESNPKKLLHLSASTPLIKDGEYYKIDNEE